MQNAMSKQKSSLIENLAHDLKSPIYSQINALNLLLGDKSFNVTNTQRELLSDLLASNMYMKDMVLNILLGFRLKCENFNLDIVPHNFHQTLNSVIKSIKHVNNSHKISVISDTDYICAEYDDTQIKRVLSNLLTNACKHSTLNSEIKIVCEQNMGDLVVKIINDGHIDFEQTDDIFKPYKTNAKTEALCGSGLGLYISKQIIEHHGGQINALNNDSEVCVTFKIPIISKRI